VQRYPPGATIGWHRDAPAFETVIGVSLASACRLRSSAASATSGPARSRRACQRMRRAERAR
jgi:alkylated DNA repair dioxygenase AlkB